MSKKFVCDFCSKIFDNESQLSILHLHDSYYEFLPKRIHICRSCQKAFKIAFSDPDVSSYILSLSESIDKS